MIRAFIFFVLLGCVVFGVLWLLDHPGTVVVDWPGFGAANTSVAHGIGLAIALVAASLLIVWLLMLVFRAPMRVARRYERSRREKGYHAISLGMVAVAAGDAQEARRQAKRANSLAPNQPLTTLLSAQSSQMDGDAAAAQKFFTELAEQPDAAFLGLRGLWVQATKDGRTRDALHYAQEAHRRQPSSAWVLDSLLELQTRLGQWEEANATLDALARQRDRQCRNELCRYRALVNVEVSRAREAVDDKAGALRAAEIAHKAEPTFVPAAAQHVRMQIANGRRGKAEKMLQDAWNVMPHPLLADAYRGVVENASADKRVELARSFVTRQRNNEESRIMVARFAMAAGQWNVARRALEPLTQRHPPARVCRMMADLETQSKGDDQAARDWLAHGAVAAPDPAWVCSETGAVQADWSAVCRESQRLGTLEWRVPYHVQQEAPAIMLAAGTSAADIHLASPSKADTTAAPVIVSADTKVLSVIDDADTTKEASNNVASADNSDTWPSSSSRLSKE